MAIKNYLINDKWLDLDKQNIVEVKSTDGVIGSVKLNGEEYGGGGGSSDFSTAEVTMINNTVDLYNLSVEVPCVLNKEELLIGTAFPDPESDNNIEVVIYKSTPSYALITGVPSGHTFTCTGSVRIASSAGGAFTFEITGDGTITIS